MGELKDKRKPKGAGELAVETSDAVLDYLEGLRTQSWKKQDEAWQRVKKSAAKYRIAAAREKKNKKQEGML